MGRWTDKNFKMSVGAAKQEEKSSFSDVGDAMSQKGKYSKKDDPANKFLQHVYAYLETPAIYEARSSHRLPGLHASSLHSTCARREILVAIALMLSKSPIIAHREAASAGGAFTQDLGHALHDWWQNKYLGDSGLLYGKWRCLTCGNVIEGTKPKRCKVGLDCIGKKWARFEYQEMEVHVKGGLDIHGHSDGILLETPFDLTSKRRIFELKTKSPTQYPTIHSPDRKHVIQVHTYMVGLGLDEAIIVYTNKGKQCAWTFRKGNFIAGKPHVKAYLVPFDPKLWESMEKIVREYHEAKRRIDAVADGTGDPKVLLNPHEFTQVCESEKCSMARSCGAKDLCFSV
jgi:hypothetical protein